MSPTRGGRGLGSRRPGRVDRCSPLGQTRVFARLIAGVFGGQAPIGRRVGPVLASRHSGVVGRLALARPAPPLRCRRGAPAGFLRPRPPREPRRRRFLGRPFSSSNGGRSVAPAGAEPFGSAVTAGDVTSDLLASPRPARQCRLRGREAGWVIRLSAPCSERSSSDIDAFSHDARASSARGRVSAVSGSNRVPSRSIHWWVRSTRASTNPPGSRLHARSGEHVAGLGTARLRGELHLEAHRIRRPELARRITGSTSSSTSRPLRRRESEAPGAQCAVNVLTQLRRVDRCAVGPRVGSTCHTTAVTASCNAGARSASGTAPVTAMPSGSASVSDTDNASSSTSSANTRSRYSASLSCPVESAKPKLTLGRGEKPSVNANGSFVIRNARSSARATSRWRDPADLAPLRVPEPHRVRRSAPHDRRPACGLRAQEPDRARRRRRSRSWPVPWLPPAGAHAATPPRARGRSRYIPRSRSTESTGNRGARARRGPPASPARGNRGAGRPRCGPTGSTSSRVRWRVTYQSGSRPSACMASTQRSSEKCSLHSWNVPPARQTALDHPPDAAVAAADDALRRTSRSGRATCTWALVPLRRRRAAC